MMARKDQVVRGLTRGVDGLFKKNKVESVRGDRRGSSAPGRVEVTRRGGRAQTLDDGAHPDRDRQRADRRCRGSPFDGERIVSSTEALALPRGAASGCSSSAPARSGSSWARCGGGSAPRSPWSSSWTAIVPGMDRAMGAHAAAGAREAGACAFRLETRRDGRERRRRRRARHRRVGRRAHATEDARRRCWSRSGGGRTPTGLGARELGVRVRRARPHRGGRALRDQRARHLRDRRRHPGTDARAQGARRRASPRSSAWPARPGT